MTGEVYVKVKANAANLMSFNVNGSDTGSAGVGISFRWVESGISGNGWPSADIYVPIDIEGTNQRLTNYIVTQMSIEGGWDAFFKAYRGCSTMPIS